MSLAETGWGGKRAKKRTQFRARRGSYLVRGHLQAIKWSEVCRSPRDFLTNVQLVLRLLVAKMAGGFWLIQVQHKH